MVYFAAVKSPATRLREQDKAQVAVWVQGIRTSREWIEEPGEYKKLDRLKKMAVILAICDAVVLIGEKANKLQCWPVCRELLALYNGLLKQARTHGPGLAGAPAILQERVSRAYAMASLLTVLIKRAGGNESNDD